jgi:hypothetical protein
MRNPTKMPTPQADALLFLLLLGTIDDEFSRFFPYFSGRLPFSGKLPKKLSLLLHLRRPHFALANAHSLPPPKDDVSWQQETHWFIFFLV